jgi:hypothetical protein
MPLLSRGELEAYLHGVSDVEVLWDEAAGRVTARVVLPVEVRDRQALARAVSRANSELKLVGFRLIDERVVFSFSAFTDADGRLASAVLDRLVAIARVAVKGRREELARAAAGEHGRRTIAATVERRPLELSSSELAELAAATLHDLPALAPLAARASGATEIVQPFFAHHRVVELELEGGLPLHLAVERSTGEARLLTTRLDTLNRIAAAELSGADLDREEIAFAYALHASEWARPALREERLDALAGDPRVGPPRVESHVSGHQVDMWVRSDGKLVRRHVLVALYDGRLEILDEPA